MPVSAHPKTFRPNPGKVAPRHVVDRLARFHPTVRLVWNTVHKCWQLIERGSNMRWSSVRLLRDVKKRPFSPTIENTTTWLNMHDMKRVHDRHELDKWLSDLDSAGSEHEAEAEARASGMIEEGADRVWRATGKRIPVAVKPSHEPTHSPETRGAGAAESQ